MWVNTDQITGVIDCTHVRTQCPALQLNELYRNRKYWFSINIQAVCDVNLKLTSLVTYWYGPAHDSCILDNSLQRTRLDQR